MDVSVDLTRQLAHEIQAPFTSLELQLRKLSRERPESELAGREVAGFGLGLAISKRLAEAQRGSLCCKSDLGRGSSFILTLPAT